VRRPPAAPVAASGGRPLGGVAFAPPWRCKNDAARLAPRVDRRGAGSVRPVDRLPVAHAIQSHPQLVLPARTRRAVEHLSLSEQKTVTWSRGRRDPRTHRSGRRGAALRGASLALLAVALVGAGDDGAPPLEAAPANGFLEVTRYQTGYLSLGVFGQPAGSTVQFDEVIGGQHVPLRIVPTGPTPAVVDRVVRWRCDRTDRHFSATVTDPDGSTRTAIADIRTPSCADRVAVRVPRHVARDGLLRVQLVDRWGLGNHRVQLCVSGAGLAHHCRKVSLVKTSQGAARRFRVPGDGLVRVAVRLERLRVVRHVAAGSAPPLAERARPVLLTTGDSTIEGIDSVLQSTLRSAAQVQAESHPGTRLSGDGDREWDDWATDQVRRLHPAVTVISLGGNEGYNVDDVAGTAIACCGPAWVAALARRQRHLMGIYGQREHGSLIWMLLPVPRSAQRARIQAAVNQAAVLAAGRLPFVRLLDQRRLFTPDGEYHDTITRDGHQVRVRAPDGIHLSAAGQAIAAAAVVQLVKHDGLLGR
ncbi:MAG: hypothetical protein JWM31_2291, partial [Solirubrobacterales bacterium]|nr:hypothetical protein [Solirubrobacterales bacterium]